MPKYTVTQVFVVEATSKAAVLLDLQVQASERQIETLEWQSVIELPAPAIKRVSRLEPWLTALTTQVTGTPKR